MFITWLLLLPLALESASAADQAVPCTFPRQCGCSLRERGSILICASIERCANHQGMNALAESIRADTCPVSRLSMSCTLSAVWPVVNIRSRLFSHPNWKHLKALEFGAGCAFQFLQLRLLSQLPELKAVSIAGVKLETDLAQFSSIFCCPPNLQEIRLKNIRAETMTSLIDRESFINLHAVSKISIINSTGILPAQLDLLMNTSSPKLELLFESCFPTQSRHFSNISLVNLVNGTRLVFQIKDDSGMFKLDAPAKIKGFEVSEINISNSRIVQIENSSLQGFSLKTCTIVGADLNGTLVRQLFAALTMLQRPDLFRTLSVEFLQKTRDFPFDELNLICSLMPHLHMLSISHSTISLTRPKGRYLNCSQLTTLWITNCNLTNDDLPKDAFSYTPNLTNVKLDGNKFYVFPTNVFKFTKLITELSMGANNMMEFTPVSLHGILPSLTNLQLSDCGIKKPLTNAFINQLYLKSLIMNRIQSLGKIECPFKTTWFRNCTRLTKLSLASNQFLGLSRCEAKGFFDPLASLEELNLSYSYIGSQQRASIRQLFTEVSSTLQILQLKSCNIRTLDIFMMTKFTKLRHLNLEKNALPDISPDLLVTKTPNLTLLELTGNPLVYMDPMAFSRLPKLRVNFGPGMFNCNCEILPFTDWMRQQLPIYKIETIEDYLTNAHCRAKPDGSIIANSTVRLVDFSMPWLDCYNRRLILILSLSIASIVLIFCSIALIVKYRFKLQYAIISFLIKHQLLWRNISEEWIYDGCFIYDETDVEVSQWVEMLTLKLESDLQLRLYEPERDTPAGANILDEAASAIDKSRHAVLVLSRGFLDNRLNMYSAQWSNESLFMRGRSVAVMVMRERLTESDLRSPECKVVHRLYRMCKPDRIIDCSGCGVGSNSANRLGLMLYKGARVRSQVKSFNSDGEETEPLIE